MQLPARSKVEAHVRCLCPAVALNNISTRLYPEKVGVSGELMLFMLYDDEEEDTPVQWMEASVPFDGSIDVAYHLFCTWKYSLLQEYCKTIPDKQGSIHFSVKCHLFVRRWNRYLR